MLLKKLTENNFIAIRYNKNGKEKTCRGYFHHLDTHSQTLFLINEEGKIHSVFLGDIKEFS